MSSKVIISEAAVLFAMLDTEVQRLHIKVDRLNSEVESLQTKLIQIARELGEKSKRKDLAKTTLDSLIRQRDSISSDY